MNEFEGFSEVYDDLSYDQDEESWAKYIESFLPEGALRVLECACGTGRITKGLVKPGRFVIGVDRSEGMLRRAERRLRPLGRRFALAHADMRDFRMEKPADAVVCACDGVNYLLAPGDLRAFFSAAFHNLRPGGVFAFDISSAWKIRNVLGNEFFFDDGDEETLFWQNELDADAGVVRMSLTTFIKNAEGLYVREDEEHVQRAWTEDEIAAYLRDTGFESIEAFDFGTRDLPGPRSERIQFAAKKRRIE